MGIPNHVKKGEKSSSKKVFLWGCSAALWYDTTTRRIAYCSTRAMWWVTKASREHRKIPKRILKMFSRAYKSISIKLISTWQFVYILCFLRYRTTLSITAIQSTINRAHPTIYRSSTIASTLIVLPTSLVIVTTSGGVGLVFVISCYSSSISSSCCCCRVISSPCLRLMSSSCYSLIYNMTINGVRLITYQ